MPIFRALTSLGLVDALEHELGDIGVRIKEKGVNWVQFESSWQGCLDVNRRSHVATRVILPVLDFKAFSEQELYQKTLRHDFTQYIDPDQTLCVTASISQSNIRDQRMLALKVKDAVVDQFRDRFQSRPSIDRERPHLRLFVRCVHNSVSLAVDTSGRNLSDRGYRLEAGLAPLKEHLAAGLLEMTGWTPEVPLLDPMCGSGTFLIEAALMALGQRAKTTAPFAFQSFKKFRGMQFAALPVPAKTAADKLKLFGSDRDMGLIARAKRNAERAGVHRWIQFHRCDFRELSPPAASGMILVNPPYGERLMADQDLVALYKDFAAHLKQNFTGWTLWLLSGQPELAQALRLKAERKIFVANGDLECRWLKYGIVE
jgi:23S rRNA (guanine2445-N2)-methyltransferase / 23S rRNA (guanine2069-N7)-methyltransferase